MSFREVRVFEVREALRLWLRGESIRSIERMAQLDRKTVRRYVKAAEDVGLVRANGEGQLTDELIGSVVEVVRPHRSDGHGEGWRLLVANHAQVKAWLDADVTAVKVQSLLARRGVDVPRRTVQRYASEVCGAGRRPQSTFVEYAQSRGFAVDPARVRTPTDKPRVERNVAYVQSSFFAGEEFADLADAQRRAAEWCATVAGLRTHGTIQARPAEVFAVLERPVLLPAPTDAYDLPTYPRPKVARDHHIEVDKAIYSVPGNLIGHHVDVRADRSLIRVYHRGQLIKVHVRTHVGGRRTDPGDLPAEKTTYALRDIEHLKRMAAVHGPAVGAYASALLDTPLPWTRMRQVYALLGLVKRWGAARVDAACARALEAEAVNVGLIGRMLERATEKEPSAQAPPSPAPPGRFARDAGHFAVVTNLPLDDTAGGAA